MNFEITEENYAAKIVELPSPQVLKGCNNVMGVTIDGMDVIVGKNSFEGDIGVLFPPECVINHNILKHLNAFSSPDKNKDNTKHGYFPSSGRVKAQKFRGHNSNAYFLPLTDFVQAYNGGLEHDPLTSSQLATYHIGQVFNKINGQDVCWKFVNTSEPKLEKLASKTNESLFNKIWNYIRPRKKKITDLLVNPFPFHYNTAHYFRSEHMLPKDVPVYATKKYHGTSAVFANLKTHKQLNLWQKFVHRVTNEPTTEYSFMWASRTVLKGVHGKYEDKRGWYKQDVWKEVADLFVNVLPKDCVIYGEIVGYAGNKQIQKGYDYGCKPWEWKFVPYRLIWNGEEAEIGSIKPAIEYFFSSYYLTSGFPMFVSDKFIWLSDNMLESEEGLTDDFIKETAANFAVGRDTECSGDVPQEGAVIRLEGRPGAWKIKSKEFLNYESKVLDNQPDTCDDGLEVSE